VPTYLVGEGKPLYRHVEKIAERIQHIENLLDEIVDEDILPALARNYDRSGLKKQSGQLYQAITKRGAKGNVVMKRPGSVLVGIDLNAIPYAKWVIDGRGEVRPTRAKALHWIDPVTGKDVFAKRSRPTPPHDIYYLTPGDLEQIEKHILAKIAEGA
jgi:hypothetical protein